MLKLSICREFVEIYWNSQQNCTFETRDRVIYSFTVLPLNNKGQRPLHLNTSYGSF